MAKIILVSETGGVCRGDSRFICLTQFYLRAISCVIELERLKKNSKILAPLFFPQPRGYSFSLTAL